MRHFTLFLLFLGSFWITSCEDGSITIPIDSGLSETEIVAGLKAALKVGTDTSSKILSATDGYLKDQAVKILLPDEVQNSIAEFKARSFTVAGVTITGQTLYNGYSNNLLGINIAGLKAREDDLIMGINRAAENAASTAGPIFFGAIEDITINDANDILFGNDDRAATNYLASKTSVMLFNEYEPRIDQALGSITIGGTAIVDAYESFVTDYNAVLNTPVLGLGTIGSLMNVQTISTSDISAHATQKGLDGLFLKVAEEEEDIRKDPLARVSAILQKVFGELD